MRAGTLSDPRVVTLLRRHFVCAHIPMLATADLIAKPEDRAYLTALNDKHNTAYGGRGDGPLFGGEREVFLAPDGSLIRIGMTLHAGGREHDQVVRRNRVQPERAVAQFFDYAAQALRKVHGKLPQDWEAIQSGTDPEVGRLRKAAPPLPSDGTLRIWVRNDRLMYEGLVGHSRVALSDEECRALTKAGAWPRDTFVKVARAFHPRGDVYIDLKPESVEGSIETFDVKAEGGVIRGRFRGRFALLPRTERERGRRAKSFLSAQGVVEGDFEWNGKFTRFRLVTTEGSANFQGFAKMRGVDVDKLPAKVTAREHKNVTPELYGSKQPFAVAVELVR